MLGLAALGLSLSGSAHAQEFFTTWNNVVKPSTTIAVGGVSQEFTYTSGAGGVTGVSPPSTNMAVTVSETLDGLGDVASMVVKNANRGVGFYKANGDTFTILGGGRVVYARASDWTRQALTVDALALGWAYQTFTVWQEGLGLPNGSMGAASVGAITPGTSVPQTGAANFYGLMSGIYNDAGGQDHVVLADMRLNVNFAAHSAAFTTSGTIDRTGVRYSDLDITGTFVSLPNHPALFGTLNTARLTGTSSAQFYGPAAEEVGGVFTLTPKSGTGLERLAGAFGGKRATPPPANFTSWATALQPGYVVTISGKSQEINVTGGATGVTAATMTEVTDTTVNETISPSAMLTGLHFGARGRTIGFNTNNGDFIGTLADPRVIGAVSRDLDRVAIAFDPEEIGWNYQTFGLWQTTDSATTGGGGVVSIGAATPGGAIPTAGAATFKGYAGGLYVDTTGTDHMVSGLVTVAADFGARRASFSSTNMVDIFEGTAFTGTDLSGVLTYAAGQNALTGTLTTANGRLSGTANAQFFGPIAQEIGGLFALSPAAATSIERLIGGFGAKR
jgi:hypothetical protein